RSVPVSPSFVSRARNCTRPSFALSAEGVRSLSLGCSTGPPPRWSYAQVAPPRFPRTHIPHAPLSDRGEAPASALLGAAVLPSVMSTTSALATLVSGLITRSARPRRPGSLQRHATRGFRLVASLGPGEIAYSQGPSERFPSMSLHRVKPRADGRKNPEVRTGRS